MAWLHGLYIYEAFCDVSPILRAFSKAKKPNPYPDKPYEPETPAEEESRAEKERKAYDANKTKFEAWVIAANAQMAKKGAKKGVSK